MRRIALTLTVLLTLSVAFAVDDDVRLIAVNLHLAPVTCPTDLLLISFAHPNAKLECWAPPIIDQGRAPTNTQLLFALTWASLQVGLGGEALGNWSFDEASELLTRAFQLAEGRYFVHIFPGGGVAVVMPR